MRKWKKMTQKEFESLKLLQKAGLSQNQVVKVTGRGVGTVANVYKYNDLDEYLQAKRQIKNGAGNTVEQQPTRRDDSILEEVKTLLTSIDERLKFIEENIQVNHRSKRLFG